MTTPTVLIVDDEVVSQQMAVSVFVAEGYHTLVAENGEQMHEIIAKEDLDLIILDINLPGKSGLFLAREIRENSTIPLIFLTGSDNEYDKILGLEIGADDYLTKPFNPRELAIRARNLINRTRQINATSSIINTIEAPTPKKVASNKSQSLNKVYHFSNWQLDLLAHNLINPNNEIVRLPRAEFKMLQYFCEHPHELVTRQELLKFMMGRELKEHDRTVDVTIRKLRRHFDGTDAQYYIETIFGEGYRFGVDVTQN